MGAFGLRWPSVLFVLAVLAATYATYSNYKSQQKRLAQIEALAASQAQTIELLHNVRELQQQHAQELQTQQKQVQATLQTRQHDIRKLQTEVAEIREWASTKLPTDIERLRQRPALTGARDYYQLMPNANPLHPQPQ